MKITKSLFATAFVVTALVAGYAHAVENIPGHPRINEVNDSIDIQQNRVTKQEAAGKITAEQAAKDQERLANESQRLSADEAKNGGHIIKAEQHNLNKSLNRNNRIERHQVKKDAAAQ